MVQTISRQLRWLKAYAIISPIVFAGFLSLAFTQGTKPQQFEEISVERINIIEKSGALKMVISNAQRQHPGAIDGKTIPARQRPAGLIFFNTDGDECGGLAYDGTKKSAGMVFSVDQYKNDQVMQLQYEEELEGKQRLRSYGLRLWDRPDNFTLGQLMHRVDSLEKLKNKDLYQKGVAEMQAKNLLGQERLFVGKNGRKETGLFIRDESGKSRIKLYVDPQGEAKIEMLNAAGEKLPLR